MGDELLQQVNGWFDEGRDLLDIGLELRGASPPHDLVSLLTKVAASHPQDARRHALLLQAHAWAGDTASAEACFERSPGDPAAQGPHVEEEILRRLGAEYRSMGSDYRCLPASTVQNIGFWEHRFSGPSGSFTAITKIMLAEFAGREPQFFEAVAPVHPALAAIAPRCLGVHRNPPGYVFLTMEKVKGDVPDLTRWSRDRIDALIATYAPIASIPGTDLPIPEVAWEQRFGFNHGFLAGAFHRVNDPLWFEALLDWSLMAVRTRGYVPAVVEAVESTVRRLRAARPDRSIEPARHFTLLHGDLHRYNVLAGEDQVHFIDWARWTSGPRGIDLAVLLRRCDPNWTIERLEAHGILPAADRIARLLFCLALIVTSLMIDIRPIKEEPPEQLFLPMCREIERCLA